MKDDEREFYAEFGRGFRAARDSRGHSQTQVGKLLGLTRASIG